MNVIFMGTPELAIPTLQALIDSSECTVQAVYTQPDRRVGRKKILTPCAVKAFAEAQGIPVKTPENARDPEVLEELKQLAPQLIFVCAYGQILTKKLINVPPLGCFNSHFSLLPRWRGASPVHAAIRAGDATTGVSIQKVVRKLDAGDIVHASAEEEIQADDTYLSLVERLSLLSGEMVTEILPRLMANQAVAVKQDENQVTFCRTIGKEEGQINWAEESAVEIDQKRRAFTPWPGIFTFDSHGKRIQIMDLKVMGETVTPPGMVQEGLVVGTKEGAIQILSLKPEGKKAMSAHDFLKGHAHIISTQLQ